VFAFWVECFFFFRHQPASLPFVNWQHDYTIDKMPRVVRKFYAEVLERCRDGYSYM
jgi:hypothetical protein